MLNQKISNLITKAKDFERILHKYADVHYSFLHNLNLYLKINPPITHDELDIWISKNQSQIGSLLESHWVLNRNNYLYSFIKEDDNQNEIWAFIKTDSSEPKSTEVKNTHLLFPSGRIPKMWLFEAIKTWESNIVDNTLDRNTAHNTFLADALKRIVPSLYSPAKISLFLNENKSKIDKIRSHFSMQPKLLGQGSDGVAFQINDKMILKIFTDQTAFFAAKKAQEWIYKNPQFAKTEAMIYDIGVLGHINDKSIYYYIMEKMIPAKHLPNDAKKALSSIIYLIVDKINKDKNSIWRSTKKLMDDSKKFPNIKNIVSKNSLEIANHIKNEFSKFTSIIEDELEVKSNWLELLIEELIMKYLTSRTDLYITNIGLTNYGEFRYFDPVITGYSSDIRSPDFIE